MAILTDKQVAKIKPRTQIVANLKETIEAHRTRQKLLEKHALKDKPRVIAMLDAAGWLEVYTTKGVIVKVLELPETGFCTEAEAFKELELSKMMGTFHQYKFSACGCAREMTWKGVVSRELHRQASEILNRARLDALEKQ